MDQRIRMVLHTRHIFEKLHDDVFRFNEKRGYVWIQKLCFAILQKLGCHWLEQVSKYSAHDFTARSFLDALRVQRSEIFDYVGRSGQRLIIGEEDFYELMGIKQSGYCLFTIAPDGRYGILGMSVEIVPWMRGIVVLP